MQIHHIEPDADGGSGDYENGIPVCLDCHAEIESRSNMGRSFTAVELKEHRDRWFGIVRDRPEVLLRAAQTQTETGPLEALLAEMEFNTYCVGGNLQEDFPPAVESQFQRAVATNALAALPPSTREAVQRTYVLIRRMNQFFQEILAVDRKAIGTPFHSIQGERNKLRAQLVELLPRVRDQLEQALGRAAESNP